MIMRKTALIIVLLATFLSFSIKDSFAQISSSMATDFAKDTSYQLPYPGILPDNPLYPLKAFRDQVVNFLITDSIKKSEFYIFAADKHLNSGIYLFKKGKIDLAESMISKGENYLDKAVSERNKIQGSRMEKNLIDAKLATSLKVHKSYLDVLEKDSSKEFRGKFTSLKIKVAGFEKGISAKKASN